MRDARRQLGPNLFRWAVVAFSLVVTIGAQAVTQDITSQFAITRSGLVLNRTTNTFDSTITLKNTSGAPVLAPIDVVVGGLPSGPNGVTLYNKVADKPDGRPYVSPLAAGVLLANGSAQSFVLKFANPTRVTFTSTLQILRTVVVAPANAPSLLGVVATGAASARVIGRVDGAPNQDVALQMTAASTCVAGTLVNGVVGGTVTARTDASGYFQADVSGVNPGSFVALQNATAGSPSSLCQVSARDNDSWPKAFLLEGSGPTVTVRDLIDTPTKARWYKFAVTPGQRIDLKLNGLPTDYDLAVFKDIGQAFASQFNPTTAGTNDLLKLTAEYAPSTFSPSTFSPSTFSPSTFSPDAYSPSTFSPSTFSPSVFSPSTFSPSTFSPSTFSPSTFSPSTFSPSTFSPSTFSPSTFSASIYTLTEVQQAFSTAQTRSIIAISATAGLSDEATVVNTWNRTGYFYARVTGRGGAFDTSTLFTLNVTKGVTTCVGVTDTVLTPRPAVPISGLKTVMLTDSSKVAFDAALPGPAGGTLRSRLAAFAARAEIKGVVVDVAGDARVSALRQQAANNPACPFAKNLVAEEIKGIVDAYRANPLQYVVIVGNDDAIPFFRSPDESAIGKESGYVPPVQSNSPSEASLRRDFVLSQDRYGSKTSISLPWNEFPVPDLAVGRLVETASEIAGLIDAYVEADGVVSPHTSLVTGYDFLEDAASAVKIELDKGTGSAGDALITPNGTSPQADASWTATQLHTKLFGSRHDVIFLAGHFSANSALAADFATSVLTTDLAASTNDFTNSIVFSAGCHAGYSLVDGDAIPGVTLPLDWAQAFARKQATLIAGTGYQYGDTDFLEYSERLYNNLARQLRAGLAGTPVAVGAALVQAKLAYLAATPDIRGLHEKALLQATLFGLPMLAVNMPAGRGALPGTSGVINPALVAPGPSASLGLKTYDLGVAPDLTTRTQTLTNLKGGPGITATWLSGPDGVVTKPGEPALPLAVVNVTPTDPHFVLRGIGYLGGSYVDSGPLVPFTGAATTESRGVHVSFLSPVFYPSTLWTPNYIGALAGNGGTQLLVSPVQYRAASVADGTSTQRRHTGMNLRLFYSSNLSQAALSDAPSIVAIDAQPDVSGVTFSAQVVGDPAAAIYEVWVTYTGDGTNAWISKDLEQCVRSGPTNSLPGACGTTEDSRLWKLRIASPPANIRYFVQAANGVGLVSRNDNAGAFFGVPSLIPAATRLVLIAPPSSAIVGDTPTVTAKLTDGGGVALAGKTVAVGVGGAARLGTTGIDGSVTIKLPVVADPGGYQITAAFLEDGVFQSSSTSAPLDISRATVTPTMLPVGTGGASAGINITGVLGGTNTSPQGVAVTFTVNGPSGTTTVYSITDYLGNAIFPPPSGLPPGNYTVTQASFGGNGTYAPTTITFPSGTQVSVPKLDQGITFDVLAGKTFGNADFGLFATASSGLAVSYGASGACTVAGSTVHLTGIGSCTITADQAGNATYNAAATVTQGFSIGVPPVPPTVVSLVRAVPSPTMADTVTFTLTFSEAVTGGSADNFSVVASGITGASITGGSQSPTTFTVTVNTGRGTGTLRLDMVNGTGITNTAGTALAGTPVTGETFEIDKGGTVLGSGEGQPVAAFGNGGYALFSDAHYTNVTSTTAVLADGRILGAGAIGCTNFIPGDVTSPFLCTLQIARYLANGAPDTSFGTNGRVVAAVTNTGAELDDIIVNGDGTILVASARYDGTNHVPFVAKFTSAGAPDTSFGTNGVTILDSLPVQSGLIGIAVDGSGRIVIAGTTPIVGPDNGDILVARLTNAGALDSSFGNNGVAQFAISVVGDLRDRSTAVAVRPDGKIVVGGSTRSALNGVDFLVLRLDDAGARDASFGTNGVVTTRFTPTGVNNGRKLVLQPDGKIVLVGFVPGGTSNQCGIARFDANGALDPGFGAGGQVLALIESCTNVSLQPDGKLVVVGLAFSADVGYATFTRLLQTGAPDNGFGTAGYLAISSFDYPPARVSFTSSGNLVTMLKVQDPADGSVQKSYVVELSGTFTGPSVAQSITFNPLPDKTFGDPDFAVSASASSGLPVSFGATGACTVAGSTVHLTGTGSCTISADQAGDATYNAATQVIRTFAITSAAPPPTVVSLVRAVPSPTMVDSVTYTLTFSEAVTGVATSNFAVATSGIAAASVAGVSGAGTTWTVTVNTGRGTGTLHLDVVNGTGITNTGGTLLAGTPVTGETYQVDKGGTVLGSGEGQPVAGFGTGGYAPFSEGQGTTTPGRIRVLSDGRILAAGGIGCAALVPADPLSPYYCTLQLARYSATGVPDASFGTNGRIVTAVTSVNQEVNLRAYGDGTLLASGTRYNGTQEVPFVAKFTSAGAPDPFFGTNGVVSLDSLPVGFPVIGSGYDVSGRILIVGTTLGTEPVQREDIFVTRLTGSGATDTSFGTNGVAQFALSTVDNRSDRGTTFDVQPDGKILVGGRTKVTTLLGYDFLLMRLDDTGARDLTFGTNGVVTTRFPTSTGDNFGRRLVLMPDGKIVLVGSIRIDTDTQCGIARFNANGTLDSGFGTGGRVLVGMSVGCFNVNWQADGKLVVVGNDKVGDVNYGTFARLLLTGALDAGFGNGGLLKISNFDTPTRVAFSSGNPVTGLTIQDPADGVLKSYVVELTATLTGPWVAQTIALGTLPGRSYGETFQLPATASSGLTVSYSASGACSVAGNFVQPNGVGTCTITANQAGNATYFAATQQVQAFPVTSASQGIIFGPAPVGLTVGQPLVTVVATSSSTTSPPSALPITFSSLTPSVCTTGGINGANLTFLQAGPCTIQATQAGDANYGAATQTQSFTVGAAGTPPNTYVVSNLNDVAPGSPGSAGSLRDAIAQANASPGPDIIDLSGVSGTIVLTQGSILIAGPTVIVGPGAGVLTIDGNAGNRIFSIGATFPACPALDGPNDYLVSIAGLRLANGRRNVADSSGGAIYTEHSLALDSMVIENSVARAGGGVMFSIQYPGQSLTIANSRFLNNVATEVVPATPSATANSSGGGLYIVEKCQNAFDTPYTTPVSVTIAGSEFRGNSAQPVAIHGRGGAIRSYSRADIVIVDTSIVDNHVDAPNPPVTGSVYHGGAFEGSAKSLRIERSEIAENTANAIPSSDAVRSGGLHIYNSAVDLQGPGDRIAVKFVNSTISGNASTATAGAMAVFGNVALELSNSTVSDNEAAPTRTGGILISSGDTYPVSASNTSRPTLKLVSSILANSLTGNDIATNTATIPSYAINATNSLIEKISPTSNVTVFGSGNLTQVGPVLGPDPVLGPLAYNGGTTRTHALLAGSPAINAGSNPLGLSTDQRSTGFARISGAAADMGAYESGSTLNLTNYAYLSQFGSPGGGNGQFNNPVGVAIDPTSHNIVVTDAFINRVQIFSSAGVYLSQFGSSGAGNGQFSTPNGVAIDPTSHNIVVTDINNSRVQIFSSAGVYLGQFGTFGTGNGQFGYPYGVAIDPTSHNIVVADSANNRVQIFNSAGVYLSQFGSSGAGNGQFGFPYGVAIDPTSHDIVVGDGSYGVQIFSSTGVYLSRFGAGGAGGGNGQFNGAHGVAIDPTSHNIVVADAGNNRVQIFSSAGEYLSQFGSFGLGNGQLRLPSGVAIDPTSHNIVVTDTNNSRVQIFAPQ